MGCDIHLFVEVRKDGKWEAIKDIDKIALWQAQENLEYFKRYGEDEMPGYTEMEFIERIEQESKPKYMFLYNGRNYNLFSMLADVRNGYTSNGKTYMIKPIDEPRGVPSDASDAYKEYVDEWGADGHSYSYFTLTELDTPYWLGTERFGGYVMPESFKAYMEQRSFGYLISSVPPVVDEDRDTVISNEEMEAYVTSDKFDPFCRNLLTFVEWDMPRFKLESYFYNEVLGYLRKLGEKHGKDNVRIVFFFDN